MNYELLNRLVKTSGKTKRELSAALDISRMTLDTILAGGDVKVSTLEALSDVLGVWPGIFFDDPAGMVCQTGGQNNISGDNIRTVESVIPAELVGLLESKDRQVERLISVLEGAVARDIFMLMFHLIGINAADLLALTADSVRDGRVEYRRAKTGRLYSIRIEPEAREIIDRYGGLPLEPLRGVGSADTLSHRLEYRLGRLGIRDDLTPYFARHTWATLAARLDVPRDTISEALGHSYGSRTTGIYVQFAREKIDGANRRVLDFVYEE